MLNWGNVHSRHSHSMSVGMTGECLRALRYPCTYAMHLRARHIASAGTHLVLTTRVAQTSDIIERLLTCRIVKLYYQLGQHAAVTEMEERWQTTVLERGLGPFSASRE